MAAAARPSSASAPRGAEGDRIRPAASPAAPKSRRDRAASPRVRRSDVAALGRLPLPTVSKRYNFGWQDGLRGGSDAARARGGRGEPSAARRTATAPSLLSIGPDDAQYSLMEYYQLVLERKGMLDEHGRAASPSLSTSSWLDDAPAYVQQRAGRSDSESSLVAMPLASPPPFPPPPAAAAGRGGADGERGRGDAVLARVGAAQGVRRTRSDSVFRDLVLARRASIASDSSHGSAAVVRRQQSASKLLVLQQQLDRVQTEIEERRHELHREQTLRRRTLAAIVLIQTHCRRFLAQRGFRELRAQHERRKEQQRLIKVREDRGGDRLTQAHEDEARSDAAKRPSIRERLEEAQRQARRVRSQMRRAKRQTGGMRPEPPPRPAALRAHASSSDLVRMVVEQRSEFERQQQAKHASKSHAPRQQQDLMDRIAREERERVSLAREATAMRVGAIAAARGRERGEQLQRWRDEVRGASIVQRLMRGWLARSRYRVRVAEHRRKQAAAATRIQAAVRAVLARARFLKLRRGVVRMQAAHRGRRVRHDLEQKRREESVRRIQAQVRMQQARTEAESRRRLRMQRLGQTYVPPKGGAPGKFGIPTTQEADMMDRFGYSCAFCRKTLRARFALVDGRMRTHVNCIRCHECKCVVRGKRIHLAAERAANGLPQFLCKRHVARDGGNDAALGDVDPLSLPVAPGVGSWTYTVCEAV